MNRARCVTPLLFLLAFLPACASTADARRAAPGPADELIVEARSVRVFDGDRGEPVEWSRLVEATSAAEVVILGENHGHPLGLSVAAALWEDILGRSPAPTLSMEFFERDEQLALDDYLGGTTDLGRFLTAARRTDSNFPPGHRQMVEAARRAGRPVIAANAPRRYVRLARLEGFDRLQTLTDEQRRMYRIPDELIAGRYRDDFDAVMSPARPADAPPPTPEDQAATRERTEAIYRSQQVWDWTMADSIVRALSRGERPVVHVVGRFHSDFRGGTVQAIERLRPGTHVMVVSIVDGWATELAKSDAGRGDFVLYVGPSGR